MSWTRSPAELFQLYAKAAFPTRPSLRERIAPRLSRAQSTSTSPGPPESLSSKRRKFLANLKEERPYLQPLLLPRHEWRTHPSFNPPLPPSADRTKPAPTDYARLDYLGGKLLEFYLVELALDRDPRLTPSGANAIVSTVMDAWLSDISVDYDLPAHLKAPPEFLVMRQRQPTVRAALLKSYLATMHLGGGSSLTSVASPNGSLNAGARTTTRRWVRRLFKPIVGVVYDAYMEKDKLDKGLDTSHPMTKLSGYTDQNGLELLAEYEVEGSGSTRTFRCKLKVDGKVAEAVGLSKRQARSAAAALLVAMLAIP